MRNGGGGQKNKISLLMQIIITVSFSSKKGLS